MESPEPSRSTDEEVPPGQTPEDLSSRLQSLVRSLQASPRALRRALDARLRGGESPSAPGSPSLGRRLISRLLPAATPSSVASSGGGEESCGGPCSTSSSSAPTSSGVNPPVRRPQNGAAGDTAVLPVGLHPMTVPEIVLQAPDGSGRCDGEEGEVGSGPGLEDGGGAAPPIRPSALESTKLLTLVVCGGGGGSGGSSTVVDGGGSEASVAVGGVVAVGGGDGGEVGGGIAVVPARKSPVTVQEWVDSLPHSGATTPVPHEASLPGALHCRSEEEEGEERAELAGEGATAVPGDMVEDGLSLGAEAGHLYTGSVPDEIMCPRQRSSGSSPPPAPASQTSRRERPGGGSSATAKRREAFAGRRETEGGGSFQSDSHSPASHSSIDSLLESRRPDPEEMLFGLGFGSAVGNSQHSGLGGPGSVSGSQRVQSPFPFSGCGGDGGSDDEVSRIPRRFLQPSKVKGVAINDFFKYQQDLIETFESGFCGYRGLTGPSHTVPSVIVAKIMEKLREHERESSSRGSVASYGTGPNCQSPTPPPTPPFSPTSNYVGSPLCDDRLNFLHQQPHPISPIVSPIESQPTTKFSKKRIAGLVEELVYSRPAREASLSPVQPPAPTSTFANVSQVARNVMHRSSVLTRMSSGGGDSLVSSDDVPGIACSPTGRTSLSVLTPDNRKFLDSQGSKSPETPRKRMIIGQRSFTFGNDGDLIEDLASPEPPTSPTLPSKPPLLHKDSVISSIASLTSCDSDSDTDSAPNIRKTTSTKPAGGNLHRPSVRSRAPSCGLDLGPWPLGKRLSSTSLSSWEELGDGPSSAPSFALLGQRPRFLSIDEGDDENMDDDEEPRRERWVLGDDAIVDRKWPPEHDSGTNECHGYLMDTGSNEGSHRLGGSDKTEGSSRTRENSMNEGLWELELDQPEASDSEKVADVSQVVPSLLDVVPSNLSDVSTEKVGEKVERSNKLVSKDDENTKVAEELNNDSGKDVLGSDKGNSRLAADSVSQDTQVPSDSSYSNFSSYSSTQDSCLTPLSIRRGSLKRQTKFEIEEERAEEVSDVNKAAEVLSETLEVASPPSQTDAASLTESAQQVVEVSSVGAESPAERQPPVVMEVEEVQMVVKKETDFNCAKEEDKRKRALSPHGRSGSAHSDSSGFLEWEPPNVRVPATPQSPPPCQHPKSVGVGKDREWIGAENNQLPSPDGGTTVGSSGYYGVEGLASEMTVRGFHLSFESDLACWRQKEGHQLQTNTVELALRSFRREMGESGRVESGDGTGRELALGGGAWQGTECMSEEGVEEESLQLAHRELCFVREMRCCVSEGMERVMQFLGTWTKRRQFRPCQTTSGETDRDSTQVTSIMSQMTFLLKQQSQLCYEMEQLSMQRLLDGQPLGGPSRRESIPEVKGNVPILGIREGEKSGTVVAQRSEGDVQRPSPSQSAAETAAGSKERCLEGMVEQNARELAELKLLLRAVLIPNQSDRGQ